MSFKPSYFGRYLLLDFLSKNRNAEFYRAKLISNEGGPARLVTLKKVVGDLGDQSLVKSFEQEIKITVGLTHPNIVQTYDFGTVSDQYFMTMEYLPGRNLSDLAIKLVEQDLMFSPELSCHIVGQICQALSYAHTYKDRVTGESRAIIHRDLSPAKVMISYDGAVKLVEFGMAKMESPEHFTRVGAIEGEPGYMSPERLFGEDLDGRADVYSTGVLLWEMLAGRVLRSGSSSLEDIRQELGDPIPPPSKINPSVPKRLDKIVLKAVAYAAKDRYASAAEFQRELHQFLYSFNPSFNPQDLSLHVQEFFAEEIVEEEAALRRYLQMKEPAPGAPLAAPDAEEPKERTLASIPMPDGAGTGITIATRASTQVIISANEYKAREMEKLFVKNRNGKTGFIEGLAKSEDSSKEPLVMEKGDEELVLSVAGSDPWKHEAKGSQRGARLEAKPEAVWTNTILAPLSINVAPVPPPAMPPEGKAESFVTSGQMSRISLLSGGAILAVFCLWATVTERGSQFRHDYLPFGGAKREVVAAAAPLHSAPVPTSVRAPASVNALPSLQVPPGQGVVLFEGDTANYELELNGRFVPVIENHIYVPLNEPLHLHARKAGGAEFIADGSVPSAGQPWRVNLAFQIAAKGSLSLSTTPEAHFRLLLQGKVVIEGSTPLDGLALPAGNYRLQLQNDFLGTTEEDLVIESGKTQAISRVLTRQ